MLKNKTAIITGASRGIGKAIAIKLASMGANVALIYAGNEELAINVCNECESFGVTAKCYKCNVSSFEETKNTVSAIRKDFGAAHILVNNAGVTKDGLVAMMSEDDFDKVISTNLKGAFNMIRHTTGLFIRSKEGSIINISSVSGLMGNVGQANYSASKAGLIGLSKSVAKELAGKNIRCNCVAPGFIETDMTKGLENNPLIEQIPLKRMGKPEEVAEAVAFLAMSQYITGEVIRIDGGIGM